MGLMPQWTGYCKAEWREAYLCLGPHRLSIPGDMVQHLPSPRFSPAFLQSLAWVREAWTQVLCGFGPAAPCLYAFTSFPENPG